MTITVPIFDESAEELDMLKAAHALLLENGGHLLRTLTTSEVVFEPLLVTYRKRLHRTAPMSTSYKYPAWTSIKHF